MKDTVTRGKNKKLLLVCVLVIMLLLITCCSLIILLGFRSFSDFSGSDSSCYSISGDKVFLNYEVGDHIEDWFPEEKKVEIKEADPNTFESIYHHNCWVYKSNPNTLVFGAIAKDKNNVYVANRIQENVSPQGFGLLVDDPGIGSFFSNNNSVYYFDSRKPDLLDLHLNPAETEALGYGYVKDNKSVYLNDTQLNNVDALTFRIVSNAFSTTIAAEKPVTVDKYGTYINGDKIEGIVDPLSLESISSVYYKDTYNIYFLSDSDLMAYTLHGVNEASFVSASQLLDGTNGSLFYSNQSEIPYGRDNNFIWYQNLSVPTANPSNLKPLNKYFWSDGNNVYFKDKLVEGAKFETFTVSEYYSILGRDSETGEEFRFADY